MNKRTSRYKGKRKANYYSLAGTLNKLSPTFGEDGIQQTGFGKGLGLNKDSVGLVGGLASAAGGIANSAISGGLSSGAGDAISGVGSTIGSALSTVNPLLGGAVTLASNVVGGLTNAAFGSKMNNQKIAEIETANTVLANTQVDASSNSSILNQWSGQDWGSNFKRGDIGRDGWFSSKAKDKYKQLQKEQALARNRAYNSYDNAIAMADNNQDMLLLQNYAANGGPLSSNGTIWDNGLTFINNGGTHEANPYEGVQVGVDHQGVPNLVEEGEVIWDDYVFSERLKVPKAFKDKYKLKGKDTISFAEAAEKFAEESKERPNDPISKRGRDNLLNKLVQSQESVRQAKQEKKNKQYAKGGHLGNLFDGTGPYDQYLPGEEIITYGPEGKPLGKQNKEKGKEEITSFTDPMLLNKYYNNTENTRETPVLLSNDTNDSPVVSTNDISVAGTDPRDSYTQALDEWRNKALSGIIGETSTSPYVEKTIGNDKEHPITLRLSDSSSRYAPIIGSGISVINDIFNKPDYTSANIIMENAAKAGTANPIGYNPVGNYMSYKPFDRNFYTNKLSAEAGATRRAIFNSSSPSRNAALLAADFNAQSKLGDLARQAEEYNLAQRQKVEDFNRSTNITNSEMALKTAMANQEESRRAKNAYTEGLTRALTLRDTIDQQIANTRNANYNSFLQGLADIGNENEQRNWLKQLYASGYFGKSYSMERALYGSKQVLRDYFKNNPNASDEDASAATGITTSFIKKYRSNNN